MIQDRALKATALQFLVSKRFFPQLEVLVLPRVVTGAGRNAPPLTDIDVLGLMPDDFEGYRSILIDCRTLKSQSPVSRALWLRGLMDEVSATQGLCVLRANRVESDHRIAASRLSVLLVTEAEFDRYIGASGGKSTGMDAHCANLERWETFLTIGTKYQQLAEAVEFTNGQFWMPKTAAASCRKTLALVRRLRGELDPAKPEHVAVVANFCALFLVSVAQIVMEVFTSYLHPAAMAELSEALLIILYGGKENYDALNSFRRLVKTTDGAGIEDLSLPEWDRFVQFTRESLERPVELNRAPLIMRECAWTYLSEPHTFKFAETLIAESPLAAKYALLGSEYLCRAAKLPPEFATELSNQLLRLQKVSA